MIGRVEKSIKDLRRNLGATQEQMAAMLGMSIPTYIKTESGNRDITVKELINVSRILNVPTAKFFSEISTDNDKFRQMYFYILKSFDAPIPKTKLAKLLYLSDFGYFYFNKKPISGMSYIHKQYGPLAKDFLELTDDLYESGKIRINITSGGAYMISLSTSYYSIGLLSENEKAFMEKICKAWRESATQEIVNFAHEQSSWKDTIDGEEIEYKTILSEPQNHVCFPVGYNGASVC